MDNRITDIEIRLTHQEAAIDELTRAMLEQDKLIKKLVDELVKVRKQIGEVSIIARQDEETPPPHY